MRLRFLAVLLLLFGFAQRAAAADRGQVVLAFGAGPAPAFTQATLHLRCVEGCRAFTTVTYIPGNPLASGNFTDGDERGSVHVLSLAAGQWVVDAVSWQWPPNSYRPLAAFAIPFTVIAGQTTYIGDVMAVPVDGVVNGKRQPGGLVFVVRDHSARDIPLARKNGDVGEVQVALIDAAAGHSPEFLATGASATGAESRPQTQDLCATSCQPSDSDLEAFKVESFPAGAAVATSTGASCPATPCTLQMPRKGAFRLTLTMAGYAPVEADVRVGAFGPESGARPHFSFGGVVGALAEAATGGFDELTPNPFYARMRPLETAIPLRSTPASAP
jgi:hypothetical protein